MAGLEERLKKLEGIVHNLFCCDNNQFTGPQGPPGPIGLQGPPGQNGEIIFQNLNWLGDFVPCVVYNQFDAVSYNGSSYFLNCESSTSFECETPDMNPECWILLANAGAPGAQGPTGQAGNDGSNSGRWRYAGLQSSGLPSPGAFTTNVTQLDLVTSININKEAINSANYYDWLSILNSLNYSIVPAYLQIVEVGNNAVIALYEVTATNDFIGPVSNQSLGLTLNYIGGQAVNLELTKQYTISWVLNGLGSSANKTVGTVIASDIPGTELIYDFNIVRSASKDYCVYLPDTTQVGKEVVVFSGRLENVGFYIQSNSEISVGTTTTQPVSTGHITTFGIDEGSNNYSVYPNGNYKFTFLGNIAAKGKAFWNMEALPNTYYTLSPGDNNLTSSTDLRKSYYTGSYTALTSSDLYSLFPNLLPGEQVFAPNQPGGPKVFIKTSFSWYSTDLTIVT
ncbi:MAG: hypothetical protein E6R13_07275 [Spirochaetes bacterium]|nr:MAG: hypothetical protein E6R13_07275 [Spirochaetota bacterium]